MSQLTGRRDPAAALPDISDGASEYERALQVALQTFIRDTARRLWALESTVEIAPRHPRNLFMATAPDGSTDQPEADLISGWDGQAVRAAKVGQRGGDNVLYTYDPATRSMLEEMLLELREQNKLLMEILTKKD